MRELCVKVALFPIRFLNSGFRFLRSFHLCHQGGADEWPRPDPTVYRRARASFSEEVFQLGYCEEKLPPLCGEDRRPDVKDSVKRTG